MNAKHEAFAIKMEEIMKEMLSTEAFEQLATTTEPEFVADDTTTTSPITEEDMIRIIKKEPNEKPLLVEDYTPLNSAESNKGILCDVDSIGGSVKSLYVYKQCLIVATIFGAIARQVRAVMKKIRENNRFQQNRT